MSNANTATTNAAPKTKTNRAPYGFALTFPQTFTLRDLRKAKSHKVKYITLYMRVKKALANGEIVVAGEKAPKNKRRGRREVIYNRVNATTPVVSASTTAATV
jgi:hypothetical protein